MPVIEAQAALAQNGRRTGHPVQCPAGIRGHALHAAEAGIRGKRGAA
jgi:hypothetical protein